MSHIHINQTNGNDANDGSELHPLQTASEAMSRAVAGDVIHLPLPYVAQAEEIQFFNTENGG